MSKVRRITWYDVQRKRKSFWFFRFLDRSFRFRLLLAALIALTILTLVQRFELCRAKNYSPKCEFADFQSIITVSNVESFSIVAVGILYILERGQRKRREHFEMFNLIRATTEAGVVRNLERIEAIETLCRDGLWLDGQDFHAIDLEQLNASYARLRGVNFSQTILRESDFRHSDLVGTNFTNADLTGANLRDADLTGADLTGANLMDADLTDADLTGANLTLANLTRTKIQRLSVEDNPG